MTSSDSAPPEFPLFAAPANPAAARPAPLPRGARAADPGAPVPGAPDHGVPGHGAPDHGARDHGAPGPSARSLAAAALPASRFAQAPGDAASAVPPARPGPVSAPAAAVPVSAAAAGGRPPAGVAPPARPAQAASPRLPGVAGRRVLCLWLPRLAAERELRRAASVHLALAEGPLPAFAVADEGATGLRLVSCTEAAEAAGLAPGMGLADARAIHPALVVRLRDRLAEARFRAGLLRWAGRFSPWAAPETPPDTPELAGEGGLALDITGCAHLFGGEAAMAARMVEELEALGLTARAGVGDGRGAAWALARCGAGLSNAVPNAAPNAVLNPAMDPDRLAPGHDGDAIAPDAHATRLRSPARGSWARGRGAAARPGAAAGDAIGDAIGGGAARAVAIAPPGQGRAALAPLPVAALRLPPATSAALSRLGLRRIGDLYGIPRASLARRFGIELPTRLDQALAQAPEPVSPVRPPRAWAVRLTLPEPIGLRVDLEAALARLLIRLAERLEEAGMGARRLRLSVRRVDGTEQARELGLARPGRDPDRLAPLFAQALDAFDAGFGIDAVRLEATVVEPLHLVQRRGHFEAQAEAEARRAPGGGDAFADLLGRLGSRIGLDRLMRFEPADTHIPEKTARLAAAAWSQPRAEPWPAPPGPRPVLLLRPEPLRPLVPGRPPALFRWRRQELRPAFVEGPERIAPEWWLDDPEWRTGPRDYWRIETDGGLRLWLFQARGRAAVALGEQGAWFVHGVFA